MNIRTQSALTLTELLVSTILIGIVMTGVAAFSLFVKQARDSTSQGTILAVKTATAMHYIASDAMKATGDSSDRGIRTYESGADKSICFRQDVSNPSSYADDIWVCHYHGTSFGLSRYYNVDPAVVPCTGGTICGNNSAEYIHLVYVQTSGGGEFFNVVNDADGRLQHVDITLNTIADPGQAASTIANPTQQLFTRVSPPAHGR